MKPPLFSCLTSRIANNGSLYGRFLFGPLPIDLSLTVATVLRRSLLHNVSSFTIVSAEIEGVSHEYASLPGIQESILEILLNLGEVSLTSPQRNFLSSNFRTSNETAPYYFASIKISGPCIIEAKDIHWPKGIFCVKPDAYICTLSSNETFHMRLKIEPSPFFLQKTKEKTNIQIKKTPTGLKKELTKRANKKSHHNLELQTSYKVARNHSQFEFFKHKIVQKQSTWAPPSNKVNNLLEDFKPSNSWELWHEYSSSKSPQEEQSLLQNYFPLSSYCKSKREALKLQKKASDENEELKEQGLVEPKGLVQNPVFEKNQESKSTSSFQIFPQPKHNSKPLSRNNTQSFLVKKESPLHKVEKNREGSFTTLYKTNPPLLPLKETVPLAVKSSTYPVEKVNFLIERDDEFAGYRHRIILEVWTNGSISPRQAIFDSIGSIIQLIYGFREPIRNVFNSRDPLSS